MTGNGAWDDLSPDVAAVLGDAAQRQANRRRTLSQKRQTQRDRARAKLTLDVTGTEWLRDQVYTLAAELHSGPSSTFLWLAWQGLQAYRSGQLPEPRVRAARSLKHDYELLLDPGHT